MTESAISTRDERRMQTTHALIRAARHATAERGLAGFTVEDLCEAASVSRRTFFNYFASKEDAVIGIPIERSDEEAIAAFVAGGDPATPELSATLLTDLAALHVARSTALGIAPDTFADLRAAVDREPRLLPKLLEGAAAQEQFDTELVERREGLPPGDLRAEAATQIVGAILRAAAAEFLGPENSTDFRVIFERRLLAARSVLSAPSDPNGTP